MKHILSVLILFLVAGSSIPADLQPFPFYRELRPPTAGAGASNVAEVASVLMDSLIYEAGCAVSTPAESLQARMKIIGPENIETPFCFRKKTHAKSSFCENHFPAEVLSFKELPDNRAEVIIKRDTRQPVPAGLWISASRLNFEKQVTVSGSMDSKNWILLAEAVPIFDYSRFIDVRNDRVSFAANEYLFFKVEIANITESRDSPLTEIIRKNPGNANAETTTISAFRKEPFRTDRISFLEQKEIFLGGETETRDEAVSRFRVATDPERRRTMVNIETVGQPLTALKLETGDSNFSRPVSVAGADAPKGPWTDLVSGQISRVDAGKVHQQHLEIRLDGERRYRHYRLLIDNHDNPPIAVTGVRTKENLYEVLFFPKGGFSYRLYYGGSGGMAPNYDTETVLRSVPPEATRSWTMDGEKKNPLYKSRSRFSLLNGKILLIPAVIFMVCVLVWAIYRTSRQVEATGND
jgi:hypothetical protein